jgi:hypothetical protein
MLVHGIIHAKTFNNLKGIFQVVYSKLLHLPTITINFKILRVKILRLFSSFEENRLSKIKNNFLFGWDSYRYFSMSSILGQRRGREERGAATNHK